MKRKLTTILLIISMFFIGCNQDYEVIEHIQKYTTSNTGTFLNPCICEFETNRRKLLDSCNKYNVGDTITFKK
jgi:thioredoxin-related protein